MKLTRENNLSYMVMFDVVLNVQLARRILKLNYPNWTVMSDVEHTVSSFFNDFSKISIVNQMISSHKVIYNIFGSGTYHKPHYILKQNLKSFTIKILVFLE